MKRPLPPLAIRAICTTLLTTLLTLLMGTAATSAMAQWKWRDAEGRVNLSDRPPPGSVPAKDILMRPAQQTLMKQPAPAAAKKSAEADDSAATPDAADPSASAPAKGGEAAATKSLGKDPELEARKRKAEQDKEEQRKAEESKRAAATREQCQRARHDVTALESGMRMSKTNSQGEVSVMDDAAREAEVRRLRQAMAGHCKG